MEGEKSKSPHGRPRAGLVCLDPEISGAVRTAMGQERPIAMETTAMQRSSDQYSFLGSCMLRTRL